MDKDIISHNDILVLVPVYKKELKPEEMEYFNHNCSIFRKYPLMLVAPNKLDVTAYCQRINLNVEYFPTEFFRNVAGYNKLMLSPQFYERFQEYKYILICQTDAFVFKDELLEWCAKGYDYVGAPWVNKSFFLFQYIWVKTGLKNALQLLFRHNIKRAVGNGGLSLRKVSTFLNVLKNDSDAARWEANEDFYWSFFAKYRGQYLKKPAAEEAGLFSIELSPRKIMKRQNGVLPVGIHAWEKIDPEFWKPFIQQVLKKHNDK